MRTTGTQLRWSLGGWNNFIQRPHRCQQLNDQCCHPPMQSSVASKNHFASHSVNYQIMYPIGSKLVWPMLTESWVITMERLMIPHIILGHPVSNKSVFWFPAAKFSWHAVLDPWISYEGLIADCENDTSMQRDLERLWDRLQSHYHANYVWDPAPDTVSTCWRGPVLTHGKYKSQKVSEFSNFVHKIFIL